MESRLLTPTVLSAEGEIRYKTSADEIANPWEIGKRKESFPTSRSAGAACMTGRACMTRSCGGSGEDNGEQRVQPLQIPRVYGVLPELPPPCYSHGVMQVTVKMPDEVARQWGETPEAVGRHVLEDAAIEGYRAGRLSHRQVGEMLGLDYWQTEAFLKQRGVPVNYSAADLEADNATLDKILGRS